MAGYPYNTTAWKKLRKSKLRMDPMCACCKRVDKLEHATRVDHIKPINQGGDPWAWDNLQSLCESCHNSTKQAQDKGGDGLMRGCDEHGRPLDPHHWWNQE